MDVDDNLKKNVEKEKICCGKCSSKTIFCMEKIRDISKKMKIYKKDVDYNDKCTNNLRENFDSIGIIDNSCDILKINDDAHNSVKIENNFSDAVNIVDSSSDAVMSIDSDRTSRIKNLNHDSKIQDIAKYSVTDTDKLIEELKAEYPEIVIQNSKVSCIYDATAIVTSGQEIFENFEVSQSVASLVDESESDLQIIDGINNKQNCPSDVDADVGSQQKVSKYCDICCLGFSSQSALDDHLDGSKHKRKQRLKENLMILEKVDYAEYNSESGVIRCTLCDVVATSPQTLSTHLECKKHKSRERAKRGIEENGTPAKKICLEDTEKNVNSNIEKIKEEDRFFCNLCQMLCNSMVQFAQHISSKKHVEKMSGSKATTHTENTSCLDGSSRFALSSLNAANTNNATFKRSEFGKEHQPYPVLNLKPSSKAILSAHLTPRAKEIFRCDICCQEFLSRNALDEHLGGSKHHRKKDLNILMNIIRETESDFECNSENLTIRCTLCDVIVNSSQSLMTHVSSSKHILKGRRENEEMFLSFVRNVCSGNKHRLGETTRAQMSATVGDTSLLSKNNSLSLQYSNLPCGTELKETKEQDFGNHQAHLNSDVPLSEKMSSRNVLTSASLKVTGCGFVNKGKVATVHHETVDIRSWNRMTGHDSASEVSVPLFTRDQIYVPMMGNSSKGILRNGTPTFTERPPAPREEPMKKSAFRELPPPFRDLPSPFGIELPPFKERLHISSKFNPAPGIQQNIQPPVARNFHTAWQSPSGFFHME